MFGLKLRITLIIMVLFGAVNLVNAASGEDKQLLKAARSYVGVKDFKYDIKVVKVSGKWARLQVTTSSQIDEPQTIIMEKANGKWVGRDITMDLSGWEKKAPQLFQ